VDAEVPVNVPPARVAEGEPANRDQWTGFSDVWSRGFKEIYAIRLVRGRLSPGDSVTRHPSSLLRWIGLSYGPAVLTLVVAAGSHAWWAQPKKTGLVLLLGTVNAGAFAAAALAWGYALKRSATIDDLLRPCQKRDWVVSVTNRAIDHDRQVVLPFLFSILPWLIAGISGSYSHSRLFPLILILLNLTWTMALIGNTSYWLLVPPIMALRLRQCDDIELRWNDPAHTEGIRTFSEGYAFSASFLALATLAVTIPGLIDRPLFGSYLLYLYCWLLLLSLWIGIVTQLFIYLIIRHFKYEILDALATGRDYNLSEHQSAEILALMKTRPDLNDRLTIYNVVAAASSLPFGTALITQYVVAIVGSIVSVLLQ
jgi:hypothetical protein